MRRLQLCLFFLVVSGTICAQTGNLNEELLAAARRSDAATIKALLAKGADVNAKSPYGVTPLFFACERGSVEIVKVLLDAGAEVDIKDTYFKSTPLTFAVARDHAEVVKLLLKKTPQSRQTAAAQAVMFGRVKTAAALLGAGSFAPELLTSWLTLAESDGNLEIVEMLKKAGAKPKPKPEFKLDPNQFNRYEGLFTNGQLMVTFKVREGKLICTANGSDLTMNPVAEHTFESQGQPSRVTFRFEGEKVVGLTLKVSSGEIMLKKAEAK